MGRAWACAEVVRVDVSCDGGQTWPVRAEVERRKDFEWQPFRARVPMTEPGRHWLMARATCESGLTQPPKGRRNHVHEVEVEVKRCPSVFLQEFCQTTLAPRSKKI